MSFSPADRKPTFERTSRRRGWKPGHVHSPRLPDQRDGRRIRLDLRGRPHLQGTKANAHAMLGMSAPSQSLNRPMSNPDYPGPLRTLDEASLVCSPRRMVVMHQRERPMTGKPDHDLGWCSQGIRLSLDDHRMSDTTLSIEGEPTLDSKFLTPEEVSERYRGGVSVGTLRNWRAMKIGPSFVKIGKAVLYPIGDLEAWDERNRVNCRTSRRITGSADAQP